MLRRKRSTNAAETWRSVHSTRTCASAKATFVRCEGHLARCCGPPIADTRLLMSRPPGLLVDVPEDTPALAQAKPAVRRIDERRFDMMLLRRFDMMLLRRFGMMALRRFGMMALRRFGLMLCSLRLLGMTLSCHELYESMACCDGSKCIAQWRVPLANRPSAGPRSRAGVLANCTARVRRVRAHTQRCAPEYAEGTVKSLPRSPSRARRGCHIRTGGTRLALAPHRHRDWAASHR